MSPHRIPSEADMEQRRVCAFEINAQSILLSLETTS